MKRSLRRLRRIELVELIYQLRKDNAALQKRCDELEKQMEKAEEHMKNLTVRTGEEALERIEGMVRQMYQNAMQQKNENRAAEDNCGQKK